ncbi:hypothetical protein C464_12880 [Halorubrum coriense DSM 10284]|uniref:Uncharacterized protein n=1 Tax=Halorubrum coriense DSM 10284 TaxID=1227466 RepID=M0EAS2_9EURY|nr:hypothetical protein [Halorubrum coriense]ELZ44906.1 hypothetical protein C464_12880 [Halorubrum coriense DSM 10284]
MINTHDTRLYVDENGEIRAYRLNAVRLVFPGLTDETDERRLENLIPLDDVAEDILNEYGIDLLELLTWPGKSQQEYFLIGHSKDGGAGSQADHPAESPDVGGDDTTGRTGTQTTIEDAFDGEDDATTADGESDQPVSEGRDGDRDTRADRIKAIVDDHYGHLLSTQTCAIDLGPVGQMPVPTSRLLQPKNLSITPPTVSQTAATAELVHHLNEERISYLHHSLLEPAGEKAPHDYLVTSRLAPFGTGHGIVTEDDLEQHLAADNDYRISDYVPGPSTDNWDLPVEAHKRYANKQTTHPSKLEQYDEMSLRDGSVEALGIGFPDYRALLAGRIHNDDRYEELFGAYGRIPITKANLEHFFTVLPEYFEVSSFGQLTTVDEPRVYTEELGSDVPGTRQSYGTDHTGDSTALSDSSDEESEPHKELVIERIKFLLRHGHEIVAVDQDIIRIDLDDPDPTEEQYLDGESRPDIVSQKDGEILFHEIEVENDTKPAALLTNLARADAHDHPVHVITESESEAQGKLWSDPPEAKDGPVSMAFKDTDDVGTIPYNQGKTVSTDECWYLLPRVLSESTWRLLPTDTAQLVGPDGSILAEGDAERPVESFEFHTPRVREDGSDWVLESASGEELRRRQTKDAAASGYTYIRKPLIPTRFEYLENTTVEFQSGNGFTIFEKPPLWEQPQQNASIRYEEAAKTFVELVTVEEEGTEIPIPTLRRRFKTWYTEQTDLKEPNKTWFGRALRVYFEVDDENDHNKTLVDRTFRFSEGLESPALSFIDDEA